VIEHFCGRERFGYGLVLGALALVLLLLWWW
jgi:hypothetical protein